MAFIDEFSKLIVKNGDEVKISDKDKALILIANELSVNNNNGDDNGDDNGGK